MATRDTLFGGALVLHQPARGEGYRANVDALILADFARKRGRATVAFNLGAGVGTVGLALLHANAVGRVVMIEIDAEAAKLARENLDANGWSNRGEVVTGDVARVAKTRPGEASLVVCNPPYFAPGTGRPASGASRARARSGELGVFVAAARALLGKRGRACFVYPARELSTLIATMRASGLEPKRMRTVRAKSHELGRLVLVDAMSAKKGGLAVETDLIERDGADYTPELARIVSGK